MYKKYTTLTFLCSMVVFTAWLSIQGIAIDRGVVKAFTTNSAYQPAVQVTSFLGVTQEKISEQRVLTTKVITRERKVSVTHTEYENLLRIVEAEAGGEDLLGKMLIANVVLNRVEDEYFPDNINEVIFQTEKGVTQFSPVGDGRFYSVKISQETIEAVNKVLQGEDNSRGALYFAARKSANAENMKWFDEELEWLFAYGGHEFFL